MQSLSDGGDDLILNYGLSIGGLEMVYICEMNESFQYTSGHNIKPNAQQRGIS